MTPKIVRDFIYLDADRLNSLYSQVFEGVAEGIVKSRLYGEIQATTQKGPITKGEIAEAQFAEKYQTTENKVLNDYMYSQLEARLSDDILQPSGITPENFRELLSGAFMVKVSGKTEIGDYNRVQAFAKEYNDLVGKAAFAETMGQLGMSLYQAEALGSVATGDQKGQIKKFIQRVKDPTQLAKEKGYYQDENFIAASRSSNALVLSRGFRGDN